MVQSAFLRECWGLGEGKGRGVKHNFTVIKISIVRRKSHALGHARLLLLGCNSDQLFFILWAASDTSPISKVSVHTMWYKVLIMRLHSTYHWACLNFGWVPYFPETMMIYLLPYSSSALFGYFTKLFLT